MGLEGEWETETYQSMRIGLTLSPTGRTWAPRLDESLHFSC